MLKDLNNNEPSFDPKKGWNRFLGRIEEEKMRKRKRVGQMMRYAAMFAAPLLLVGVWYILKNDDHTVSQTCFKTFSTQQGETKKLKLTDGSTITLNAESEINYACSFSGANASRKIKLIKGEALFEVAKNKEVPFSVDTKGLVITVHGTVFNVNAYNKTIKATLLHGSISARANGKELYLKPNQDLIYANNEMKLANIEAQNSVAWSRGVLWFENAPLREILACLQRNYQLTYQVDDQYLNKHYTASFKREEGVANILKTLSAVSGLSLTIKNQVIVVQ